MDGSIFQHGPGSFRLPNIYIPGKGKFTIVLQEEDDDLRTIADDVKANPKLKQMIQESMTAYHEGKYMSTQELIKSLSTEDFHK